MSTGRLHAAKTNWLKLTPERPVQSEWEKSHGFPDYKGLEWDRYKRLQDAIDARRKVMRD